MRMIDQTHAEVTTRRARRRGGRAVGGSPVEEDEQLEVAELAGQYALDRFSDEPLTVENGHDHRDARRHWPLDRIAANTRREALRVSPG